MNVKQAWQSRLKEYQIEIPSPEIFSFGVNRGVDLGQSDGLWG
jgi:hypothetical protein